MCTLLDSKMRPARLLKVITSQLDVLEDMKNEFENLLANINNILQKGFKWIEDESNELSFMELNHLLANGTKECLTKCHVIAKNGSEEWSHPILSKQTEKTDVLLSTSCSSLHSQDDFQNIKEDISEIEKSQLEKFKLINRKLASLEKQTMETNFKDIDTKYSMKFEEIMKEFHSASDFMSHLQFQNESLVNLMKEKTAEINDIRQTLNDAKAQSVTHLCNLNPADTQTYNEVCEKLAGNTKLIEALQSHGESTSTKVNAMECNFENISTAVDSQKKCVAKLSDDTTEFKLSIEKMLKNLTEKTDALESKVTSVENKVEEMNNNIQSQFQSLSCDQVAVGFDVCVDDNLTPKFNLRKDTVLTCFNKVIENIQDDFDTATGFFTAPCDGLYLCCLFIDIITFVQHDLQFCIYVKTTEGYEDVIATCHCRHRDTIVSDATIRLLKKGDKLFVMSSDNHKKILLSHYSHFMCALLKKT